MKDIKNHPIAVNLNTSTVPLPTKIIGVVLHAPLELRALVILLGQAFYPNLVGRGVTTTTRPLNVAHFPVLVWVERTPP